MPDDASCYPAGTPRANKSAKPTTVALSRETLSAVPPGGNPQDRTASPRRCLPNALASQCPMPFYEQTVNIEL
ncbi:hypothetical protein [Nostoc sp.]|uniref:hypothetical protein n=1 Tax=Nostoc sp. TaxID=1180 RepID=UPI002FFA0F71